MVRGYFITLRLFARMLCYVPLLLMWFGMLQLAMLGAYLVQHPEKVVSLLFATLRSVPQYGTFAADRLWQQLLSELGLS